MTPLDRFHDALVALATDARVRAAFARSPADALVPWGLEPDDHAALLAVPRDQPDRFAASLVGKRTGRSRGRAR